MDSIHYKAYESIYIACIYTDDDAVPLALPDTIEADIATVAGVVKSRFAVVVDDAVNGRFTLSHTTPLAPGKYLVDVYFSHQGVRTASPTFALVIEYSPTKPAALQAG